MRSMRTSIQHKVKEKCVFGFFFSVLLVAFYVVVIVAAVAVIIGSGNIGLCERNRRILIPYFKKYKVINEVKVMQIRFRFFQIF